MSDQALTEKETVEQEGRGLVFYEASVASTKHPDRNEDSVFNNGRDLAMVLDGVGGVQSGQVASKVACDFMANNLSAKETDLDSAKVHLVNVIREASKTVKVEGGGGLTTVAVAKFLKVDGKTWVVVGSVGDSRPYILTEGEIFRLTPDDSEIPDDVSFDLEEVDSFAEMTPVERAYFKRRNVITQSLGSREEVNVHLASLKVKPGNKFILCSDGVSDNLTREEIRKTAEESGDVAQKLVGLAEEQSQAGRDISKPDDISAVVVEAK